MNKIKKTPYWDQRIKLTQIIAAQGGIALGSILWGKPCKGWMNRTVCPPFCDEISVDQIQKLEGKARIRAEAFVQEHPRVKSIVILTDWRGFRRWKNEQGFPK